MDKLLLSLPFIVLLASLTVNSAPMPSSKIISSIQQQQQNEDDDAESSNMRQYKNRVEKYENAEDYFREMPSPQQRQNKMIGYYSGFNQFNPYAYPVVLPYASPVLYPPEFFDDFSAYYGYNEDDEIMSRTAGNRKRPGNFKNSPIYYIRLPPTPYMFVPGLGYISNPPSYTPMTPPPPPPSSIFYNLPLDFISNGKPTQIYQWGSPAYQPQPQYNPAYQRPPPQQRPYQRPMNPYLQESKVTNLKGQFLFNGRPEEIYVLPPPSAYSSIYPDPRFVPPFY